MFDRLSWLTRVTAAGLLVVFGACSDLAGYPFNPAVSLTVGANPHGVNAADFNGDGRIDLVSANTTTSNVSVLLSNGDGSFQPAVSYAVQQRPKFVEVGDFNQDGNLDLAVVNETSGTVSILRGTGNGTFLPAAHYNAGCSAPHEVAAGDLNGDGRADLVVACWNGSTVGILLGAGDASFGTPLVYTSGSGPNSVTIGDLNADGRNDFAVTNAFDNNFSVAFNLGSGSFAAPVKYATGAGPHSVRFADLNNDGILDVVTANDIADTVSIYRGLGGGNLATPNHYPVGGAPESVSAGDLNGDGRLDLVTANSRTNNVSVLLADGTGNFVAAVHYAAGTEPFQAVIRHLDGDGQLDVAVANYGGSNLSILRSVPVSTGGAVYVSSLAWLSATNGWGPVERDQSNGEIASADGTTIRLNGTTFSRGLGVHANAEVRYALNGCTSFTSFIGVDDEVADRGSVIFQVWGNNTKLFESPIMTGASATEFISTSLLGFTELRLVVTDAGNGQASDHADWADAKITCGATDSTPPVVNSVSPVAGSVVPSSTYLTALFSEPIAASSISTTSFTLTAQSTGANVAAVVTYDSGSRTATLAPSAPLMAGSLYRATLRGGATGIADLAGNRMAADYSWTFSTATQTGTLKYLSALDWVSMANGWGPAERDMSNGEDSARDGQTLRLSGVSFPRGLGVHAPSELTYNVAGCSVFASHVGVDDEVESRGSVTFEVWADATKLFDSGVMTGASATRSFNLDLNAASTLRLVVTNAGDGNISDHADWAEAALTCAADSTPPTVVERSPAPGASGAALNTTVTAVFSEAMNSASVTGTTFTLRREGSATPLAAAVSYDSASRTAFLRPSALLASGASYVATLSTDVRDSAGNALTSAVTWTFSTSAETAPAITARTPAPGATNVSVGTNVSATFSQAMDPATLTSTTFTLRKTGTSTNVAATISYNATTRTAVLQPTSALDVSSSYTVAISTAVRDSSGIPLASSETWSFTTGDTTPPTVVSRSPAPGAQNVSTTTSVTAVFSEAMNSTSIDASTFMVRKSGGTTVVSASVRYDAASRTATLTPSVSLDGNTSYSVVISTGVRDLAGNPITSPVSWSFTTKRR
jgi:hypothetical protein